MFDLDRAVAGWRAGFARDRAFSAGDLDELEDHLRAAYELELHLNPGLTPAGAFAQARATLGDPEDLSGEFAKVGGGAWRALLTAGWVAFVVAFFLPVHVDGIRLTALDWGDGLLPGIQAFLLALGEGGDDPLAVASALTNMAMAATFWRISDAGRGRVLMCAALLLASVALNLRWLVALDPWTDLMAGYWTWTLSFALAGAGLALRTRSLPVTAPEDLVLAP